MSTTLTRFCYGDGTPARVDSSFIELLRVAVDCFAKALTAAHEEEQERRGRLERKERSETELAELYRLAGRLSAVLDTSYDESSEIAKWVTRMRAHVASSIQSETSRVEAAVTSEMTTSAHRARNSRARFVTSLEPLITGFSMPRETEEIVIELDASGRYNARSVRTVLGRLEMVVDLTIPSNHGFAAPVRLENLVGQMFVNSPQVRGWLRKRIEYIPQKLSRMYMTRVCIGPDATELDLRITPAPQSSGFNLLVGKSGTAFMTRVIDGQADESATGQFEVESCDKKQTASLCSALLEQTSLLRRTASRLVDIRLDDVSVYDLAKAEEVVVELVSLLAPLVLEISQHSSDPNELVIKRTLNDGRREEIFVARSELCARLTGLPASMSKLLEPLDLFDDSVLPEEATELHVQGSAVRLRAEVLAEEDEPSVIVQLAH